MNTPLVAEIGRQGLVIPLDELVYRIGGLDMLIKVLKPLVITEKIHPGRPKNMSGSIRKAYILDRKSKILIIPRIKGIPFLHAFNRNGIPLIDKIQIASTHKGELINENAPLPIPRKINPMKLNCIEPLYEYQEVVINYLNEEVFKPSNSGVAYLQMDTGLGKTRVGCGLVARRAEPALIVVPTEAIAQQWVNEFMDTYPLLIVGIYHNIPSKSKKIALSALDNDVIIIIVNTFRNKKANFIEGFGTIILDEAHEYQSAKNSQVLWLSQTRVVLGLSATPIERPDGLDRYIPLHLGKVIMPDTIPGFDINSVNFRGEVRIIDYKGDPQYCNTVSNPSGTASAILTISSLIKDQYRLKILVDEVERLYKLHETSSPSELIRLGLGPRPASVSSPNLPAGEIRRHGIYVFAEHREFLPIIRTALLARLQPEDILVPELDAISMLRGGVTRQTLSDARRAKSHIVVTTYGFGRRGISLPDMTCIVEATPRRNNMRQILGRILRRGSDESIIRQIVDIVDVHTCLRSQLKDRRAIYKEKGYPISKLVMNWSNSIDENDKVNELENSSVDELLSIL